MKFDLAIDQCGNQFAAHSRKELAAQIPGRVRKMYVDKKDGSIEHAGYVIGGHWLRLYKLVPIFSSVKPAPH